MKASLLAGWLTSVLTAAAMPHEAHSNGCGIPHSIGYNSNTTTHRVISGNETRTYGVNVPKGYNDNLGKQWPLIIDFHGNGGTPDQQYNNSMYWKYPEGQDYLIVYPLGVENHWQGPSYAVKGVDDLQFTTDLVEHLQNSYCIDTDRLYASGKSNGGGFVDTLACSDHGDQFAAFAMASAALYTDTSYKGCPKKRAILESHGDQDATIPYHPTADGAGGPIPDITEWVSWWGERTCGPDASPKFSGDLGGYNTTSYSCGQYKQVVQHYQIFDLGHCWPSSTSDNYDATVSGQAKRKCLDRALDYTPVVLDFFRHWNKDNKP